MRRLEGFVAFASLVVLALVLGTDVSLAQGATATAADSSRAAAVAELRTGEGEAVGRAEFDEKDEGVLVVVEITGNVPPGTHGLHIHERADLSDPAFESAGDHFDPAGAEHGFENPNGPHAGDLKNITVAEDGTASYYYFDNRITLSAGPNSILDGNGSALILHAMADDYRTDDDPQTGPGTSGDRIAAGAIESTERVPSTGGVGVLPLAALLLLASAGTFSLVVRRA